MGRQDRRLWTDRQDLFAGSRRDGVLAEELYILEEYRSKGLGSEYFRYMEEHKEEGVTRFRLEVEKENERAWKLYKRQGYDWLEYDQMIKEFC